MQQAGNAFDGVGFHCYAGTVDEQDDFHTQFPTKVTDTPPFRFLSYPHFPVLFTSTPFSRPFTPLHWKNLLFLPLDTARREMLMRNMTYDTQEIYFTECASEFDTDWWSNIKWFMDNLFVFLPSPYPWLFPPHFSFLHHSWIGAIEHNSHSGLMWNLALDGNGNPKLPGTDSCGGAGCRGIVTINSDGSYELNEECAYARLTFTSLFLGEADRWLAVGGLLCVCRL